MTLTVSELGDAQLVDAVRAGDETAFGTLFERYRESLVRYVARKLPGDQAEDVIQDVFASALQSMRSSDRPIVFKPWIYRIAKNACIDRHRRAGRYTAVSLDTAELGTRDESKLSDAGSGPEAVLEGRQSMESLRKAFSGLEQSHHEVLVAREFEGKSYDKISDQMGLSPAAVQSTLFRARRRLQTEYEEITTGRRCEVVQSTLDEGAERDGAVRKRRKVLAHMHDCVTCRRHATQLGMTDLIADSARVRPLRARIAALLPLPLAQKLVAGTVAAVVLVGGGYAIEGSGVGPIHRKHVEATVDSSAGTNDQTQLPGSVGAAGKSTRRSAQDGQRRGESKRAHGAPAGTDNPAAQSGSAGAPSGGGTHSSGGSNGSGTSNGSQGVQPNVPSTDQVLNDVHSGVNSVGQTIDNTNLPGSDTAAGALDQVDSTTQQLQSQTQQTVGKVTGPLGHSH